LPLQERALVALARCPGDPVLTGGGALAGFWLGHRETKDLDLFWRGLSVHQHVDDAVRLLEGAGFACTPMQRTPGFARFGAAIGEDRIVLDFVADPVVNIEPPAVVRVHGVPVRVDTAHEILVNKLGTLLSRSEVRDVIDADALLGAGGDLQRALRDAARKDGAMSPATLMWVLETGLRLPVPKELGFSAEMVAAARARLIDALTVASAPP
jgi:hypothetical protein